MKYFKSLDGLRFYAVFLVIIHHWLSEDFFLNALPNGRIGVTIFFVLSGYLITGILMGYKTKVLEGRISRGDYLKTFYIRRAIRIFPVYYLLIVFLYFYGYEAIREDFEFFVSYTANISFYLNQELPGTASHLWTLSVEEQFYIFWPFLILFVSNRYLPQVIAMVVITTVVTQIVLNPVNEFSFLLTFNSFDAFGLGGLLAIFQMQRQLVSDRLVSFFKLFCAMAGLAFIVQIFIPDQYIFPDKTIIAILSLFLIHYLTTLDIKPTWVKRMFDSKPIVYIGKVSYGVYLYHTFIPGFMRNFYSRFIPIENESFMMAVVFVIDFSVLTLVASLSWKLFESPINNLKKRFVISS